jgi:drug/metabolite transporter (DMT)-like permease
MPNKTKGIYLALITAFISGVSIFINKFAVDAVKPPLYFTSVKNLAVGILIVCVVLATGRWRDIKNLAKREWVYLVLIGIVGGSIPFYLYFTGLSMIPAINGAIIHKTLVLWVAILAVPLLKEKITKTQGIAVALLFAGNLIIGGFKGFLFSRGELFVLIATVLWAVENVLAKKVLPTVHPTLVAAFRMGLGSVVLMTATAVSAPAALKNSLTLSPMQYFWIGLTILTLFGYVMSWYSALKLAPAITVTAVLVSSTLVTNALSAVFVTHSWNITLSLQTMLVILGLTLFSKLSQKDNKLIMLK